MFELKALSHGGVAAALRKAERYRLLNEPWLAESICLDVLRIEPDNQTALTLLILARTDQFASHSGADAASARELLPRFAREYDRLYYSGIICERQASALLHRNIAGAGTMAYDLFREAMAWYEKAEQARPPDNDDAILRWNTCARAIERHPSVRPSHFDEFRPLLE